MYISCEFRREKGFIKKKSAGWVDFTLSVESQKEAKDISDTLTQIVKRYGFLEKE